MNVRLPTWLLCMVLWFCAPLAFAQNVLIIPPDELSSCDADTLEVHIANTTSTYLTSNLLSLHFTTTLGNDCGIVYQVGSISGAMEANLNDPTQPLFALPNIAPNDTAVVVLQLAASCALYDCINSGELFVVLATLNYEGGITSATSSPFNAYAPSLFITQVNPTISSIQIGETLVREIRVRNTRPGALTKFIFTDNYTTTALSITSPQGEVLSNTSGLFQLLLDGDDFTAIGDSDTLFEQGEELVIVEYIHAASCSGDQPVTSIAQLRTSWGCQNTTCQVHEATAVIEVLPQPNTSPQLHLQWSIDTLSCYCGTFPITLHLQNVGNNVAYELSVLIDSEPEAPLSIVQSSLAAWMSGTSIDFSPTWLSPASANCPTTNDIDLNTASGVGISFDNIVLPPGAAPELRWDYLLCTENQGCTRTTPRWKIAVSYTDSCGNPYLYTQELSIPEIDMPSVSLSAESIGLSDTNLIFHLAIEEYLSAADSATFLWIALEFPEGLQPHDTNTYMLNGHLPDSLAWLDSTSLLLGYQEYVMGSTTLVHELLWGALWHCPQPPEVVMLPYDPCPVSNCSEPEVPHTIRAQVFLPISECPTQCQPRQCAELPLPLSCPTDTVWIPDTYVGTLLPQLYTQRISLGWKDDNDNRIADSFEPANASMAALKRALPGDTLKSTLSAVVQTHDSIQITTLTLGIGFRQNIGQAAIMPTSNRLSLWDHSASQLYILDDIPLSPHTNGDTIWWQQAFSFAQLALLGYELPPDWTLDTHDSISLNIEWHITQNGAPGSIEPIAFFPKLLAQTDNELPLKACICELTTDIVEVATPQVETLPGIFALPPCDTSALVGGSLISVKLPQNNFFPYEIRPLALLKSLELSLPPPMQIVQAQLTLFALSGGPTLLTNVPLVVDPTAPTQLFDIAHLQQLAEMDEGWNALFQYRFLAPCDLVAPDSLTLSTTLLWQPPLPQASPSTQSFSSLALRPMHPSLGLSMTNDWITTGTNKVSLEFQLFNTPTAVGGQQSGQAPNAFIIPTAPLSQCILSRTDDGSVLAQSNGIFQLGAIEAADTIPLQLTCTFTNCDAAVATLEYGWNCDALMHPTQASCRQYATTFTIIPNLSEAELLTPIAPPTVTLCASNGPFELHFYNAQAGHLFEPQLCLYLPPGLSYTLGSAAIQWPCGSGNWQMLPDPQPIGDGVWAWPPSAWPDSILQYGLPGIDESPLNELCVRFEGITSCDLASPSYYIATITGQQSCGAPANTVTRISTPFSIDQAPDPPYQMTIHAETTPYDGCTDNTTVTVTLTPNSSVPAGETLQLVLPQGLSYLPGSCQSISLVSDCTPQINGSVLEWTLPAMATGQIAAFNLQIEGLTQLVCGFHLLQWRVLHKANAAYCAPNADSCQLAVATSSLSLPITITRPSYTITDFQATIIPSSNDDLLTWTATILNEGIATQGTLTAALYLDNGNAQLDSADIWLAQLTDTISTTQSTYTFSGNTPIPPAQWCDLMLVISDQDNCACMGDTAFLAMPVQIFHPDTIFACPDSPVLIGDTTLNGTSWQWQPTTGIACPTCPQTSAVFSNNTGEVLAQTYTLFQQIAPYCIAQHFFTIATAPATGLIQPPEGVCQDEPLVLIAEQGSSYQWVGPGILDSNRQIWVVDPPISGTYMLTLTDSYGCTNIDSAVIEAYPKPMVTGNNDYFFCPEDVPILHAPPNPSWSYWWSPGLPWLDDPTSPSPTVLRLEDQTYLLQITNQYGCSTTDTITVAFGQSPQLVPPADGVVCAGQATTLTASGASWYEWMPLGICLDSICSQVQFAFAQNTTVVLTGYAENGCSTTALIQLTATEDTIYTLADTLYFCPGQSVQIFADEPPINQPGTYCKSYLTSGGCDSITCVPAAYHPLPDTTWLPVPSVCPGTTVDFFGQQLEQEGIYCTSVTATNGCDSLICTQLSYLSPPQIAVQPSTVVLSPGEDVQLMAISSTDSIVWTPAAGLSCSHCPEPVATPTQSITYTATAIDDNGCTASALVEIVVQSRCQSDSIQIPNMFTPNGDGINDYFAPLGDPDPSDATYVLEIWSRWGQRVFFQMGTQVRWDGNWFDDQAPADVYLYRLEVQCPDQTTTFVGEVTLVR